MPLRETVSHQFVQYIPEALEDGVVYVSIEFATAAHNCLCGCGKEVVTPLSPTDWELRFDGDTVSLYPSIGNWNFPCRSHYWITKNAVRSARSWSRDEVEWGRRLDATNKARYFATEEAVATDEDGASERADDPEADDDVREE